jgi:hypothetical protein
MKETQSRSSTHDTQEYKLRSKRDSDLIHSHSDTSEQKIKRPRDQVPNENNHITATTSYRNVGDALTRETLISFTPTQGTTSSEEARKRE